MSNIVCLEGVPIIALGQELYVCIWALVSMVRHCEVRYCSSWFCKSILVFYFEKILIKFLK